MEKHVGYGQWEDIHSEPASKIQKKNKGNTEFHIYIFFPFAFFLLYVDTVITKLISTSMCKITTWWYLLWFELLLKVVADFWNLVSV